MCWKIGRGQHNLIADHKIHLKASWDWPSCLCDIINHPWVERDSTYPRMWSPLRVPSALQCPNEEAGLEHCPLVEENGSWPRSVIPLLVPSITLVPDSNGIVSRCPWENGTWCHARESQLGETLLKGIKEPQKKWKHSCPWDAQWRTACLCF